MLSLLHDFLNDGKLVTFMNDRQKGLMVGLQQTWSTVYNRHYMRHIYVNFNVVHPSLALKRLFKEHAKALTRMTSLML